LNGFIIFGIIHAAGYIGLHCALMAGLAREWFREQRAGRDAAELQGKRLPKVSVIVPVHNESPRMEGLLKSLGAQDYPAVEFIFVDDRSTDQGPQKLAAFVRDMTGRDGTACRIITLEENPGPNYKQYALGRGIEAASGEYLLFTDADCEAPPRWIFTMAAYLEDGQAGAVIGPVFRKPDGTDFFRFYQCLDHAVRYLYLAGISGLGAAGGGFGNNLILRRKSLEAIGGYDSVPFSPTEDAALVARIRSHSPYRVHSALNAGAHIFTGHEKTWKALLNQTLRWNNGGLFSPDPITRLGFNYLMVSISAGVITVPLLPLFPGLWPLPVAVLLSILMTTTALGCLFRPSLPAGGPCTALRYIAQLFFTPAWMTLLTLLGFFGVKIKWKAREIARRA
jgi:cellulose synthase/poly-beta-1,6-N-acetylglucosamine synthase-like glycosyltransferase